eukprot:12174044-Alexandrium_andersonii.AAC.1
MSASLVGSEMCIRDSRCRIRRRNSPGGAHWRRFSAGSGGRSPPRTTSDSVSYTHLTLPTICSV